MNGLVSIPSTEFTQKTCNVNETNSQFARYLKRRENVEMIILMLAAAMTVAMLIATVFGMQEEARRFRQEQRGKAMRGFGYIN